MALSWDTTAIQDHDSVCFMEAPEDMPSHGLKKGDRMLNPVTHALIWATISVDLPGITQENAPEFAARLRLVEQMWGPMLIRAEVDGKRPEGEKAFITVDEVIAHIGLRCNVSPVKRTAWLKRITRAMDDTATAVTNRLAVLQDAAAMEAGSR